MALENIANLEPFTDENFAEFTRARLLEEVESPTRIGETIIPMRTVNTYRLDTKSLTFRPVTAEVVSPGTTFPTGPSGAFSKQIFELTKTGFQYLLNETDLIDYHQIMYEARGATNPLEVNSPLSMFIYSYVDMLISARLDLNERMRWDFLQKDEYVLHNKAGSQPIVATWGVPAANKYDVSASGTDRWDAYSTADGLGDMQTMSRNSRDRNGRPITRWYMSSEAFEHLLKQNSTRDKLVAAQVFGLGAVISGSSITTEYVSNTVTVGQIETYLNRNTTQEGDRVTITLYDGTYEKFDPNGGVAQSDTLRFLSTNRVVGLSATPKQVQVLPPPSNDGTAIGSPNAGTAVGYFADGPVAENSFTPGTFIWNTLQLKPMLWDVSMAAWGFPIVDGRTTHQLKTLPDA